MEQPTTNPLFITNSQLAQVEAYQKEMIDLFRKEHPELASKENFYTNIHTATRFSIAR